MSDYASQNELEENENETQEQDTQALSEDEIIAEAEVPEEEQKGDEPPTKKRRIRKEPSVLTREPGKSLLPFSKVQKIIKADKVSTCSKYSLLSR